MHEGIIRTPETRDQPPPQSLTQQGLYVPFQPPRDQPDAHEGNETALEMERLDPSGNSGSSHQDITIRQLYKMSKDAMRQFHTEEPSKQKEIIDAKIAYQHSWQDVRYDYGSDIAARLVKGLENDLKMKQAMPALLRSMPKELRQPVEGREQATPALLDFLPKELRQPKELYLPRELVDMVESELTSLTAVDRPQIQWGGMEIREHIDLIWDETFLSQRLARLDTHSQQVVELQRAANNRQDAIDRIFMEHGAQIASHLEKPELRYPGPLPRETRTDLTYQLRENTSLIQDFSNPSLSNQQRYDIIRNYIDGNENSVSQGKTEEQCQINDSNAKTLGEIKFKVNQNDHYNQWRNAVNKAYLKQLKEAAGISIATLPHRSKELTSFDEFIPPTEQFRNDASWKKSKHFGLMLAAVFGVSIGAMAAIGASAGAISDK